MNEPFCVQKKPFSITLKPGQYFWCTCGLSAMHQKDFPMCDGSHKGTGLKSHAFTIEKEKKVLLCGCKRTKTPPFCDGTHATLP